jgi:hypothetical protein
MPQNKARVRSTLMVLIISLVSLFALGCGDDQDDFVFTNTNNVATGNVVFQFARAQAATVPTDTATLVFDFFNSTVPSAGALIYSAESPFANVVTVTGVPVDARSVVVTCYDVDGQPIADLFAVITVLPGVNTNADLSNANVNPITFDSITVTPDPVDLVLGTQNNSTAQLLVTGNFSNGESIQFTTAENAANGTFMSNAPGVATVSESGLVSGVSAGATTVDVTYEVNGVVRSTNVDVEVTGGVLPDVLTVTPDTLTVADGTSSGALSAALSTNGGATTDITGDADLTYALQAAVAGISVNANTGVVTVAGGTADGTTATVVATYDDGVNVATDTVAVTVGTPALLDAAFSEPTGAALELPSGGFGYQLQIIEYYADNTTAAGNPANYDFSSSVGAAAGVDAMGVLSTGTAGTSVISLLENGTANVLDSFTLTVSDTTVDSTTVTPDTFTLDTNSSGSYRVTALYANGNTEDLTSATQSYVYAIYSSGDMVLTLNDGFQLGTISSTATTGTGTYTVNINGGHTSGGFTPDSFTVTVNP